MNVNYKQVCDLNNVPADPFRHFGCQGGLALPDDNKVQKVSFRAIQLYDANPGAAGAQHTQSQRFLNPQWHGLRGNSADDPPLRSLIESLASGEMFLSEFLADTEPSPTIKSFLRWISAFRHVTQLMKYLIVFSVVTSLKPSFLFILTL